MVVPSKLSQVFNYENWVHAVSGAAGGCIAMTTFYPLDTVRARQQLAEANDSSMVTRGTVEAIKAIVQSEGIGALYRGLGPVLQSLCISNFVYFYTFNALKSARVQSDAGALNDLLLGSIAGVVNVLTTTPFWVVNTRLRMRGVPTVKRAEEKLYNSLVGGLIYVAKTEGVYRLWSGTVPSLFLVSNPALQFMMYEMLKRRAMGGSGSELSSLGYFLVGAAAKAFATILTYPLQLVQAKQRHRRSQGHLNDINAVGEEGIIRMMINIIRSQGLRGLFRGLEAKILQTVLTAALMFTAYEKIARVVRILLKQPQ